MLTTDPIDRQPGFRRRLRIVPGEGAVVSALEDDFHCMAVALRHDGIRIRAVEPEMERWPWTTCPGAIEVLRETFTGLPLAEARVPARKAFNCTHLYDLAVLGAAHALDERPLTYDVLVSDPVEGRSRSQLWRDGAVLLDWHLRDDLILGPPEVAGTHLMRLRDWIAALPVDLAEGARLLQWCSLVAHGRTIPPERQREATQMPPNCHTFQPEQAAHSCRTERKLDFTKAGRAPDAGRQPLTGFDGAHLRPMGA